MSLIIRDASCADVQLFEREENESCGGNSSLMSVSGVNDSGTETTQENRVIRLKNQPEVNLDADPSRMYSELNHLVNDSSYSHHFRTLETGDRIPEPSRRLSISKNGPDSMTRMRMQRKKISDSSKTNCTKQRYRWSLAEQRALRAAVLENGDRAWDGVSMAMRNMGFMRTPKQCRERYRNHDAAGLKSVKEWSEEEDAAILELNSLFPNSWARIGQDPRLKGRAPVHIRNRFNWVLDVKKKARLNSTGRKRCGRFN